MLRKPATPSYFKWFKRGAAVLFVVEGLCFVGSYALWHQINTKREYRKYLHDNYPYVLEYYYKFGETISSECNVRQIDSTYWEAEKH